MDRKYYNPEKLLSMKDIDGLEPSIYIVTSNRSSGKTTSFLIKSLKDFKESGKQVGFIYRHQYELSASGSLYKDVLTMYPDLGTEVTVTPNAKGLFYTLWLDGEQFGFAFSLSNPDSLKKFSPLFVGVYNMIMDEYQKEDGKYLPKEVEKLQSLLLTVARGGGQQSRPIHVYLLGNMVTIMNPYLIKFGIHKRLRDDTHFIKGKGWVFEFCFNKSASDAIQENGIFRAFADEDYMKYSTENVYLHDASIFIKKPKGKSRYICTIVHDGCAYGVREFYNDGFIYVSNKVDPTCKYVVTFKADDHNQNTLMLTRYTFLWKLISDAFKKGFLRFNDIKAKNAIFDILAIDLYR